LPFEQHLVVGAVEPVDNRRIELPNPGVVKTVCLPEQLRI
jgi:hypothetical protein